MTAISYLIEVVVARPAAEIQRPAAPGRRPFSDVSHYVFREPDGPADGGQVGAFLLEEYKLLRSEIKSRSEQQNSTERYVVTGSWAIYALLISGKLDKPLPSYYAGILWFAPVSLCVLALFRWAYDHIMITRIAAYIRKCEAHSLKNAKHGEAAPAGWETELKENKSFIETTINNTRRDQLIPLGLWIILTFLTLFIGFIGFCSYK